MKTRTNNGKLVPTRGKWWKGLIGVIGVAMIGIPTFANAKDNGAAIAAAPAITTTNTVTLDGTATQLLNTGALAPTSTYLADFAAYDKVGSKNEGTSTLSVTNAGANTAAALPNTLVFNYGLVSSNVKGVDNIADNNTAGNNTNITSNSSLINGRTNTTNTLTVQNGNTNDANPATFNTNNAWALNNPNNANPTIMGRAFAKIGNNVPAGKNIVGTTVTGRSGNNQGVFAFNVVTRDHAGGTN